MGEILTDEEVYELTKPVRQGAAQTRRLEAMFGFPVRRRADGRPVVTRKMLDSLAPHREPKTDAGINWRVRD